MKISDLKNKYIEKPAFFLGIAPHLNKLNIDLLKDFVLYKKQSYKILQILFNC